MSRHPLYHPPLCKENYQIIIEDEDFLVVDKPAGLLSTDGKFVKDSLISRMQEKWPHADAVHRLDLDTSGLMVVPTNKEALRNLAKQFRERVVKKEYQAIVAGIPQQSSGTIELAIAPDWQNRPKQKLDADNGKAALTHYEVIASDKKSNTSRLKLTPITGRSHQLRIHLVSIGHSILGCDFYAPEDIYQASERLLLHATELSFQHPLTGEWVSASSQAPF